MSTTELAIQGTAVAENHSGFYSVLLSNDNAMATVTKMADTLVASNTYGLKNMGDAMGMILSCMATGATFHQFSMENHIIEGRPSRRAEFMLAEFQRLGGTVKWGEVTRGSASADFTYQGQTITDSFTIKDAVRMVGEAKITNPNSNWYKDPGAMLRWRLISRTLRYLCPAATGGFYTPEEIGEITTASSSTANSDEAVAARRAELGISPDGVADETIDVVATKADTSSIETQVQGTVVDVTSTVAHEPLDPVPADPPVSEDSNERKWALQAEIIRIGKEQLALTQDEIIGLIQTLSGNEGVDHFDPTFMTIEQHVEIVERFTAEAAKVKA